MVINATRTITENSTLDTRKSFAMTHYWAVILVFHLRHTVSILGYAFDRIYISGFYDDIAEERRCTESAVS